VEIQRAHVTSTVSNPPADINNGLNGTEQMRGLGSAINAAWFCISVCFAGTLIGRAEVQAQELEPRSYVNTPVGLNFLVAGYAHTEGKIAFDPSTTIVDANFAAHTEFLAYARSLDVLGKSAKVDLVLPYTSFSGSAAVGGQARERVISGFNDPRLRFSINLYGAPALSVKEFATYKQDLIVGLTVQIAAPLGQYDSTRLVNIGNNRWSLKTEIGVSKALGPWIIEVAPSVITFTDNNDFYNGNTLAQAPFYAVQGHVMYSFSSGTWLSLDATWFSGGHTTLNGVKDDNTQTNTRLGLTLAVPVDLHNSLKLYGSTGASTRTGTEFSALGLAWQYRWGEGF
jgi:hypothetical protein